MSDVISLPRYPIPGYEDLDPEVAAMRLHNRKNQAVRREEEMEFPAYRFRPFPCALYRDWDPANKRREVFRLCSANGVSLTDERQVAVIEDNLPPYETMLCGVHDYDADDHIVSSLRERNERQLADLRNQGWAETPDGVRAAKDMLNKRVAQAAAERAFDDRKLGDKARVELDAIEDAADDHVVEVPEVRRGPGRPRKEPV